MLTVSPKESEKLTQILQGQICTLLVELAQVGTKTNLCNGAQGPGRNFDANASSQLRIKNNLFYHIGLLPTIAFVMSMGNAISCHRFLTGDFAMTCHGFLQNYQNWTLKLAGFLVQDMLTHNRIVLLEFHLVWKVPLVLGSEIAVGTFSALQAHTCCTFVTLCHIPPRFLNRGQQYRKELISVNEFTLEFPDIGFSDADWIYCFLNFGKFGIIKM